MTRRRLAGWGFLALLAGILAWLMVRPMTFFVVSDRFAQTVDTRSAPAVLGDLRAETCGACHRVFHEEWRTTMHSRAWTDPYFQVDWAFEDRPWICRNCHTPLDRQQPRRLLGFRDRQGLQPVLAPDPNPDFDPGLQHEGVTCAACHLREGAVLGPYGDSAAPHPVRRMQHPNQVCVRCHVVDGERWDTFLRLPPCGTVTEIRAGREGGLRGRSGETVLPSLAELGCVDCHMPPAERPLVAGGPVRRTRRHLWRGGHDPAMVKRALTARLVVDRGGRTAVLTLANTGTAHYLPTGTPDRHLTVALRALDGRGHVLDEVRDKLIRRILWRPVIVDLWDTRLSPGRPRTYRLPLPPAAVAVEAVVRYHLLEESRRRRIGYEPGAPIAYEIYRARTDLPAAGGGEGGEP